jgi:hypothetical protein
MHSLTFDASFAEQQMNCLKVQVCIWMSFLDKAFQAGKSVTILGKSSPFGRLFFSKILPK